MNRLNAMTQLASAMNLVRSAKNPKAGMPQRSPTSLDLNSNSTDPGSTSYVFYKMSSTKAISIRVPELVQYQWLIWKPGTLPPQPVVADVAWAAMHHLRVFSNQFYCRVFAYDKGRLVHRLSVFPKWLRYPFMAPNDLQIGNVWTDDKYRGRGLATAGIKKVVTALARPGRSFWYVTTKDNVASRAAAEHSGFEQFGWGERRARFGLRLLGAFEIDRIEPAPVFTAPLLIETPTLRTDTRNPRVSVSDKKSRGEGVETRAV